MHLHLATMWAAAILGQPMGGPESVETLAMNARRRIQRGHVACHERVFNDGKLYHDRVMEHWFDGDRIRNDKTFNTPHNIAREIRCRNCPNSGDFINWVRTVDRGHRCEFGMRRMGKGEDPRNNEVIDPRYLGLICGSIATWHMWKPDDFVGRRNRRDTTAATSKWKGHECIEVSYTALLESVSWPVRLWIVPDWGYSVVRIESAYPKFQVIDTIETDVRHIRDDIWFPTRVTYRSVHEGKEEYREEVEIEIRSLNESIDAATFGIEGMDVPIGTPVGGYRGDTMHMFQWDGTSVQLFRNPTDYLNSLDEAAAVQKIQSPRNWYRVIGAVILLVIGAVCLRRAMRRQAAT